MSTNPFESPDYSGGPPMHSAGAPRSGMVTAVAVLNFIVGGLELMCGLLFTFAAGVIGKFMGTAVDAAAQEAAKQDPNVNKEAFEAAGGLAGFLVGFAVVIGIIMILFAAGLIYAGFGVLKRAQWGRILTLILSGIMALLQLISFNIIGIVLFGAYAGFCFYVLLSQPYAAEFR